MPAVSQLCGLWPAQTQIPHFPDSWTVWPSPLSCTCFSFLLVACPALVSIRVFMWYSLPGHKAPSEPCPCEVRVQRLWQSQCGWAPRTASSWEMSRCVCSCHSPAHPWWFSWSWAAPACLLGAWRWSQVCGELASVWLFSLSPALGAPPTASCLSLGPWPHSAG